MSKSIQMPVNRTCPKCGWVHAVGSQCPLDRAVFAGAGPQVAGFVKHIDWLIHDGFNQMIQAVIAQRDHITRLEKVLRLSDAAIRGVLDMDEDAPTLDEVFHAIRDLGL